MRENQQERRQRLLDRQEQRRGDLQAQDAWKPKNAKWQAQRRQQQNQQFQRERQQLRKKQNDQWN
jgi:hypothetical protein